MFLICLKIFFVRILDVSMGTVRTMFTVKGKRVISALVGFVEVLIWFLIVKEALQLESNSIWIAVSYSLGFATGTYIGSLLSSILISGNVSIQVFTSNNDIISNLRSVGYAVSVIECNGYDKNEDRFMLYININKKKEKNVRNIIHTFDKHAFIVVNETKYVENGYFK